MHLKDERGDYYYETSGSCPQGRSIGPHRAAQIPSQKISDERRRSSRNPCTGRPYYLGAVSAEMRILHFDGAGDGVSREACMCGLFAGAETSGDGAGVAGHGGQGIGPVFFLCVVFGAKAKAVFPLRRAHGKRPLEDASLCKAYSPFVLSSL